MEPNDRIARLEGAFAEHSKRLTGLENRLASVETCLDSGLNAIYSHLDVVQWHIIALLIVAWLSLMALAQGISLSPG